jgi:pyridoxine 5-phosphate synthase
MTKLSVNINKVATLRNARGGNSPDLIKVALDCELFGAQGITVHPRPDERHIKYEDVIQLKAVLKTEFNIEGNPREPKFLDLVLKVKPSQVTFVPDSTGQLTSDHGWDTITHKLYLREIISDCKNSGIRTSVFVDPNPGMIEGARLAGADRIELYTESYAKNFNLDKIKAIRPFIEAASLANRIGLGINAGHDLSLDNLRYFSENIPGLLEVSIGHALISDALYFGLEETIHRYLKKLC